METLPATVVSRCQVVRFQALPVTEVEEILLRQGVEADRAYQLSWLSEGIPGRALEMAKLILPAVMEMATRFG
jgi:hypothetical protein